MTNILYPLKSTGSLIVFFLLMLGLGGCGSDAPDATTTPTTEEASTDTTIAVVDSNQMAAVQENTTVEPKLGSHFKRKLSSCGTILNIPQKGTEDKLLDFAEDKIQPVDKAPWLILDRIAFESGQSKLDMTKSLEQIQNIAAIMKCFPFLKLNIRSHAHGTDGDPKLATNRAATLRATLVAFGAAPTNMLTEGQPVAPKGTEAGQANNRMEVRIVAK